MSLRPVRLTYKMTHKTSQEMITLRCGYQELKSSEKYFRIKLMQLLNIELLYVIKYCIVIINYLHVPDFNLNILYLYMRKLLLKILKKTSLNILSKFMKLKIKKLSSP